jgi:CelD/BcsL family acetyltransferase involved in cellulose biosynthesis
MELTLITSEKEWEELRPEWDELVTSSFRPYPFLQFWYLFNWWKSLGGGEWSKVNSTLQIVTARENGILVGIAPLFFSYKTGFEPALRFIGQIEVTDYLDFICLPDKLDEFLRQLLDFIDLNQDLKTKKLELANIQDESRTIALLEGLCQQRQKNFELKVLQPSPAIHLPATWEEYLQSLNKKQRHEMRRKARNVERDYQVELVFLETSSNIEDETKRFIELMRYAEKKAAFLTPETEQFLLGFAKNSEKPACLQFASLMLNGEQAAAYLNFTCDKKLWVYNTGWNPDFSKASPGWVLLGKLIQWAIENGLDEVDLMRGDEEYKYRFGGVDRHVVQVVSE